MAAPTNSLGLDFDGLRVSTDEEDVAPQPEESTKPVRSQDVEIPKEKKKPYLNPERGATGGIKQDKLSDEDLAERMRKMREQNEKIKQRRLDVAADEDAFRLTQASELKKQAEHRKVQENVNRTREENAKRKMAKIGGREWDSEKRGGPDWKQQAKSPQPDADAGATSPVAETPSIGIRGGRSGGGGSRGGRGGRGGAANFERPKPPHQAASTTDVPKVAEAEAA